MSILIWLKVQANTAWSVVAAVASNQPAPARQVVIYTLVLITLAFLAPKIIKAVTK